jgi:PAS domain S-box-containing protein
MNPVRPQSETRSGVDRMAAILDMADDAIYDVSLDGLLLHWNTAAEELFGYTAAEVLGKPVALLIPEARRGEETAILDAVRRGDRVRHYQTVRITKTGRPVEVSISVTPLRDHRGDVIGATKITRDVSAQKAAESALREREERMRAVVDSAVDAIITIDAAGLIDAVNPAAEKLFGWSRAEMVGQNVKMLVPDPHRSNHDGYLADYQRTGVGRIIGIGRDVSAVRRDGSQFPVHLAVSVVRLTGRVLFTAILHDLTARRELERLVTEASAREQQRIGQDLHDGLGQQLAGLSFFCKSLETRLQARQLPEAADARRMSELISQALVHTRGLARGLNPVMGNHNGLMSALEELSTYVQATFGVPCKFVCPRPVLFDDTTFATHVYRIAQEAVTNALKHAGPRQVTLTLVRDGELNILTVEDDGAGLSPNRGQPPGVGREIMKSRAGFIGGTLDVAGSPAGGTVVRCVFPQPHPQQPQTP